MSRSYLKGPFYFCGKKMKKSKLNIVVWIFQLLLAGIFFIVGFNKTTSPISELATQMIWPGEVPAFLVRFIGASELLAALGLVLPAAFKKAPILAPTAAGSLALIMTLAIIFHFIRGEYQIIVLNIIFASAAIFVAWGRLKLQTSESV